MERRRLVRKPSAILCSDMHLREDTPTCFIGDFQKEQWTAVEFVADLQREYDCVVLHAGDLFDHWKPSPFLLSRAIELLPKKFYTVYGQHDLPQHSLDLDYKSGVNTLRQAGVVTVLHGCHWGQEPDTRYGTNFEFGENGKIIVWHHMTYITKPFPGASGGMAEGLMMKYPKYDLIVTGDNHQSFTLRHGKQLLVNPGSLTRQDADQIDFQPKVYLWYAEDNTVEAVPVPIQEGVITRAHIEDKKERDDRIDAFVSRLDGDWKANLTFEENLVEFAKANEIRKSVMDIVYICLDEL